MGKLRKGLLIIGLLAGAVGCLDWFTEPIGQQSQGTDASGHAELTTGDFPEVVPCRGRDTLPDDVTFLSVITDASQIIHIHDKYVKDENLTAVCGLAEQDNNLESDEISWDPDEGTDQNVCYVFEDNISSYLVSGTNNPGICRSDFGFETGNTFDGFPRAGIYRLDGCIENEGNGYRFRVRFVVKGSDVNKTLSQLGIEDIEGLQFFDSKGTEFKTTEEAKTLFTKNPDGFDITVRSNGGTKTHLEVSVRVICVLHQASACPEPNKACDT